MTCDCGEQAECGCEECGARLCLDCQYPIHTTPTPPHYSRDLLGTYCRACGIAIDRQRAADELEEADQRLSDALDIADAADDDSDHWRIELHVAKLRRERDRAAENARALSMAGDAAPDPGPPENWQQGF